MIQKYVSILLSSLILFSNSGWALTFHYCKDEVASVSWGFPSVEKGDACQTEKSCCAESDEHSDCCDDQTFEPSSSESKFISKSFELNVSAFVLSETHSYNFQNQSISKTKKSVPAFYVDLNAPPLYKLYCQLVFYA